jgi:predicted nuclease of restriction endonuclease-like (RecB) superfamily
MSDENTILPPTEGSYGALLADLRAIIVGGQGRAAAAINAAIVTTYWRVGERIVQAEQAGQLRAAYGAQTLARLGRTLSLEHGRGFAETSLQNMRRFYLAYPISSALRRELTWTHYRILMRLDQEHRAFYEGLAVRGRWSSRQLEREINSMLYERAAHSQKPAALAGTLPAQGEAVPAQEVFRDPYILDFLGLVEVFSERDLESALVHNIEQFLLALGTDFCFVGRQQRLSIGDEDYYVDLVFYHRALRCLVLVDLKIGAFTPADAAQMKLYLNWARKYDRREGEAEPLGLILCGSRDEQVVELLLADPQTTIDERIKVAQYLLLDQERALRERLAQLSIAYDEARATTVTQEPTANGEGT